MQVILLSHEIEAAQAMGALSGTGVAYLVDEDDGWPEVAHLSLRACPSRLIDRRVIELIWSLDGPPRDGPRETPCVAVAIDARLSPATARCILHLDVERKVACDVEIVQTGARAFTRNAAVLETDALAEMTVLCIGLGSGGSAVVDQLARAGVGRFILWDMDRLAAHNVGRHVCTLADVGRRKTRAVRDHIKAINPLAEIDCVDKDVLRCVTPDGEPLSELASALISADCVIVGTDNNASRFAINEAAWRLDKTVLYGRAFTRASGGDVIQVIPSQTPCYACHVAKRVVAEEVSSAKDAARTAYADSPVPIEPGLWIDIHPIANMVARLCLLRLCERIDSTLKGVAAEMTAPLYLWANRREHQFHHWRPMERSYDRLAILRWYGVSVRRDEECLTCGSSGAV